jgi:hypothetical protein
MRRVTFRFDEEPVPVTTRDDGEMVSTVRWPARRSPLAGTQQLGLGRCVPARGASIPAIVRIVTCASAAAP